MEIMSLFLVFVVISVSTSSLSTDPLISTSNISLFQIKKDTNASFQYLDSGSSKLRGILTHTTHGSKPTDQSRLYEDEKKIHSRVHSLHFMIEMYARDANFKELKTKLKDSRTLASGPITHRRHIHSAFVEICKNKYHPSKFIQDRQLKSLQLVLNYMNEFFTVDSDLASLLIAGLLFAAKSPNEHIVDGILKYVRKRSFFVLEESIFVDFCQDMSKQRPYEVFLEASNLMGIDAWYYLRTQIVNLARWGDERILNFVLNKASKGNYKVDASVKLALSEAANAGHVECLGLCLAYCTRRHLKTENLLKNAFIKARSVKNKKTLLFISSLQTFDRSAFDTIPEKLAVVDQMRCICNSEYSAYNVLLFEEDCQLLINSVYCFFIFISWIIIMKFYFISNICHLA